MNVIGIFNSYIEMLLIQRFQNLWNLKNITMIEIMPICRGSFKCHIAVSFLSVRAYWGSTELIVWTGPIKFKINFVFYISSYNNNKQWLLLLVVLCNTNCSYFHPWVGKQKFVLFSFYLKETGACMKFNLGNSTWDALLRKQLIPRCSYTCDMEVVL